VLLVDETEMPRRKYFKKKDYKVFESNYIHFKRKPIIIKQCITLSNDKLY